ncbi:unnamed protein product, partial [Prunus brigantina]
QPNLFSKPNPSSSLNTLPSHSSPTPSVLCVFWSKIPNNKLLPPNTFLPLSFSVFIALQPLLVAHCSSQSLVVHRSSQSLVAHRSSPSLVAHHSSPSLFAVSQPNATASASVSSQSKACQHLFLSLIPCTDLYFFSLNDLYFF